MQKMNLKLPLEEFRDMDTCELDTEKACHDFTAYLAALPSLRSIQILLDIPCMPMRRLEALVMSSRWRAFVQVVQSRLKPSHAQLRSVKVALEINALCGATHFHPMIWEQLMAMLPPVVVHTSAGQSCLEYESPHILHVTTRLRHGPIPQPPLSRQAYLSLKLDVDTTSIGLLLTHASTWFSHLVSLQFAAADENESARQTTYCELPVLRTITILATRLSALAPFLRSLRTPKLRLLSFKIHMPEADVDESEVLAESGLLSLFLAQTPTLQILNMALYCHAMQWHWLSPALSRLQLQLSTQRAELKLEYHGSSFIRPAVISGHRNVPESSAWHCLYKAWVDFDQLPLGDISDGVASVTTCDKLRFLSLTMFDMASGLVNFQFLIRSLEMRMLEEMALTFAGRGSSPGPYIDCILSALESLPHLHTLSLAFEAPQRDKETLLTGYIERFRLRGIDIIWSTIDEMRGDVLPEHRCQRVPSHR